MITWLYSVSLDMWVNFVPSNMPALIKTFVHKDHSEDDIRHMYHAKKFNQIEPTLAYGHPNCPFAPKRFKEYLILVIATANR